jgi:hypothetical protein
MSLTVVLTFIVPGDGGRTSNVANAGTLVSPALISPPSPLDRRRIRGLSTIVCPPRGANLSSLESSGNASVGCIFLLVVAIMRGKDREKFPWNMRVCNSLRREIMVLCRRS